MVRRGLLMALGTLVFLGLGAAGMWWLIHLREPPQRQKSAPVGKLVRVLTVTPQDVALTVQGFGTVRAKTTWSVVPEVSGPIVRLSPHLRAGLYVEQGELLFEIDPRPYHLTVQRLSAQIVQLRKEIAVLRQQRANHQASLRLARQNLAIADEELRRDRALVQKGTISARELDSRRQWRNEFRRAVQTATNSLALITPQIEQTEAAIAVIQAQRAEAMLQLDKTRLTAPFDAQVVHSSLDLGEFVAAGREVASLYDLAAVEIPVAVPPDELRWLPTLAPEVMQEHARTASHAAALPPATVSWQNGERHYTWAGRLVRWEAGLDAQTRTLTLVVEVREPWQTFQPGEHPPLQPGTFCRVDIAAMTVPDAVVIPRAALRENDTVYLAQHDTLVIRPVGVLRLSRQQAIITAGLHPGDRVVLSPLSAPVPGMKLRTRDAEPSWFPSTPAAAESAAVLVDRADSPPKAQ